MDCLTFEHMFLHAKQKSSKLRIVIVSCLIHQPSNAEHRWFSYKNWWFSLPFSGVSFHRRLAYLPSNEMVQNHTWAGWGYGKLSPLRKWSKSTSDKLTANLLLVRWNQFQMGIDTFKFPVMPIIKFGRCED